ncbi:HNH endonuclease signature motif containing protein [Brevibacterium album]|uniref:HNH endonuclease signature motif containing protein n=1 Tax=Brevibacterium album TaxID=417948 RepID=UPI0003FF539D|nr:HNH endonuclease signature motif containing protein [Brevibacterium album]
MQCPTEGDWLAQQASVAVTVPILDLLDPSADLPADLAGTAPLPAAAARLIASTQSVLCRLLTDPVTGTVIDEAARTYRVPGGIRRTVAAKHKQCAAPGCTRNAARCEADHIVTFDHLLPERGGLTVPENIQPLCRTCHQLKTLGILTVRRDAGGTFLWNAPLGREAVTLADPNIIEVEAAHRLAARVSEA